MYILCYNYKYVYFRNEISELREGNGKLESDCSNLQKQLETEESLHNNEKQAKSKLEKELESLLKEHECTKTDLSKEIEKLKADMNETKKAYVSRSNEQTHKRSELESTIAELESLLSTGKKEKTQLIDQHEEMKTDLEEQVALVRNII